VCDHRHILMHTYESFFKVYHRMVLCDTFECVGSFNMDWQDIRDIRQVYPSLLLQTSMAPKSYFWDRNRRLIYLPCYLRHFRFENSDLTCKVIKTERIKSCIYAYIVDFDSLFTSLIGICIVHVILWCFLKKSDAFLWS